MSAYDRGYPTAAGVTPDPWGGPSRILVYSNPFNQRLSAAWHEGAAVYYLDLGEVQVESGMEGLNPLYFVITGFDHEGTPVLVQGQYPVLSRVPGEPGYSQFCRVVFVEVPAIYMPNTMRSESDVKAGGFPLLQSDMVLCAAVL
ncbi:MAG: hypothetical protein NUV93_04580 [Firmicutes bacterium]|jgi:hypothetical protein|nr:hypothetical protein [Bacillota bacterium]